MAVKRIGQAQFLGYSYQISDHLVFGLYSDGLTEADVEVSISLESVSKFLEIEIPLEPDREYHTFLGLFQLWETEDSENNHRKYLDLKNTFDEKIESESQRIAELLILDSHNEPTRINSEEGYYLYKGFLFKASEMTEEEAIYEIRDLQERKQDRLEYLKRKIDKNETSLEYVRMSIPKNVKIDVWQRDKGKCAVCGSSSKLEYDHIIPLSKGGSNSSRNIQLLCEPCNRSKSDKIM